MSAGPQFLFCQKKPQGLASGWVSDTSAGVREIPLNLVKIGQHEFKNYAKTALTSTLIL